jgi:hypothetical protein
LNYAPYEHGFFWWGGYGISTEHTAYLNLRGGIEAPRSGSIEQNGSTVAEQIGGQIFIDTWGLVNPGNPDRAARFAEMAASVTHGGNGVYGGIFVAACIAQAFEEPDIRAVIEKGLSYLPPGSEYVRVVRAVTAFYDQNPGDWEPAYRFVFENFGYDRYPGNCHIIPNAAVIIIALLYGRGDFSETLNIGNCCGWDTDCNVGNLGAIMGVLRGLGGIDYQKWRRPINDFLACSSVVGSLNSMDIPYGASYIAKLAWALAQEEPPPFWKDLFIRAIDSCHFEYPGSTHALRIRTEGMEGKIQGELINTAEAAHTGSRSLKVHLMPVSSAGRIYVYKKTYYYARDFHDSRYDPRFSPLLYPGQKVHGSVYLPEYGSPCTARVYAHDGDRDELILGESQALSPGRWVELECAIPPLEGGLIDEAGFLFEPDPAHPGREWCCLLDDLYFDGRPQYSLEFSRLWEDWNRPRREIIQFSRLKGLWYLEGGEGHLSCSDFGEVYTGRHDWTDYTVDFELRPLMGEGHLVNLRVQGALRSYAAGFGRKGRFGLYKNDKGYRTLAETDFPWEAGTSYTLSVSAQGEELWAAVDGKELLRFRDRDRPYLQGGIGLSVQGGSHTAYRRIRVT